MQSQNLEEENEIIDIKNLFRLNKPEKKTNDASTKGIRNLFRVKTENKPIKDRIIRDIRNLFEHEEEENSYKPVRFGNFWSNSYIEHKSNGDKNKTVSVEEYLKKSTSYLKYIINNL